MNRKKILRWIIQVAIVLIVGWGVYRSIEKSSNELKTHHRSLVQQMDQLQAQLDQSDDTAASESLRQQIIKLQSQIDGFWKADWRFLFLAGVVYALAMIPTAFFWMLCLRAMGQTVPWQAAAWAYYYGSLGKYVPGKAMVVILRVGSLMEFGILRVATTLTIFMETLTTMAVGGAVASLGVLLLDHSWAIRGLSVGLLLVTLIPTFPNLLKVVLRLVQPGVDPKKLGEWTDRLSWKLTIQGWAIVALAWVGFGLSLGLVILGLPTTQLSSGSPVEFWLSVYAACALAMVIGFVSMMPGGAGVREVVLATILAPIIGPTAALSCAIWLRLTWLAAEILMAALAYGIRMAEINHNGSNNVATVVSNKPA